MTDMLCMQPHLIFLHAGPVDTGKEKPEESWDDDDWGPNWGGNWGYLASIMSS